MIAVFLTLILSSARATGETFTAARNISVRLEAQGNKVGTCTGVGIFIETRRDLDGDHELIGIQGVTGDGVPFRRAKEFGRSLGRWPRVRRATDGSYLVYTYPHAPFEFDVWGTRRVIMVLSVDPNGRIVDLRAPRGPSLCSGPSGSTLSLTQRNISP